MFCSAINKNSNWEISTKNLATFKRSDEVKDKKLYYFGGSRKNQIFKGAFMKNQYIGGVA